MNLKNWRFAINILISAGLAFSIGAPSPAWAENAWEVEVPAPDPKIMRQDNMGCLPASLFNSFNFGSERYQAAIQRLPGETLEQKFSYFMKEYAGRPSELYRDKRPRYSPVWGMDFRDAGPLAKDLLPGQRLSMELQKPHRRATETPEGFVRRLQREIARSLKNGFPPIVSLSQKINGKQAANIVHALTVSAVSSPTDSAQGPGFRLKLIDAVSGSASIMDFKLNQTKQALSAIESSTQSSTSANGEVKSQPIIIESEIATLLGDIKTATGSN